MPRKINLLPSNWVHLKEELSCPFVSVENVYEYLILTSEKANVEFKGLEMLKQLEVLSVFNFIRIQALRIEELFTEYSLNLLEANFNSSITLSREQILVLLSNMALLTFKSSSRHVYWVNFENWLTDGRPCAMAYLQGLFSYFSQIQNIFDSDWKSELVSYERKSYSNDIFPLPNLPLNNVKVHLSGKIGDYSQNLIDFANQHIGFGISGTQEEILFGSFVELCPAMIFCCDAMTDQEAIIIRNVIKYANYDGYGFDLTFCKDGFSPNYSKYFNIIAIDALDFSGDYLNALQLQLRPSALERELRKLLAGFLSFNYSDIDTGNWGCGAFGGNKCLKSLLQIIAATLTGNNLSFCCFGDEEFYNSINSFLMSSNFTISDLWNGLLRIDPNTSNLTFTDIEQSLKYFF